MKNAYIFATAVLSGNAIEWMLVVYYIICISVK